MENPTPNKAAEQANLADRPATTQLPEANNASDANTTATPAENASEPTPENVKDTDISREHTRQVALDFLYRVWPHEGYWCAFTLKNKKAAQRFFTDRGKLVDYLLTQSDYGKDAYIACASFRTDKERKKDNIHGIKAFWVDIDAGKGKPYPDAGAAKTALEKFYTDVGLPLPTIVHSGGGLHVWWTLDRVVSQAEWDPAAERLKQLCVEHGLEADPSRTADSASVLRLPGTQNYKIPGTPRPVTCGAFMPPCSTDEMLHILQPVKEQPKNDRKPHQEQANESHAEQDSKYELSYAALAAEQCAQLARMRDTRGNIPEPEWYAGIGVLKHCVDGRANLHQWSDGFSNYSLEETEKKFAQALDSGTGPTTCERYRSLNPELCKGCPFKVTSPIQLGVVPPEPMPLRRELPPETSFPVAALGKTLGDAALAIQDIVQAPLAIGGQSVLAAAALVAQARANIKLPITQEGKPASLYFITVAETGERKSSVDLIAMRTIAEHEEELKQRYEKEYPAYVNELAAYEKERLRVLNNKKHKNRKEIAEALDALGLPPSSPLIPILTCPEPTIEGLCKMLATSQPAIGIFADEGGQFIGGYGMTEENKLKTATALSSFWDGRPVKRVRSGDGILYLAGRRLSLHLLVQPVVAGAFFSDALLMGQGLLSRLLVAAPNPTSGTRFVRDPRLESHAALERYNARLKAILDTPLYLSGINGNELTPQNVSLSVSASEELKKFINEVERQIATDGAFAPIRGLANKLPEHAARIAAVLALVETFDCETMLCKEVSESHIQAGIALARFYASEALRLFNAGMGDPNIVLAERLLQWLHDLPEREYITLPDIYQRGPNSIRDKATAKRIAGVLAAHGWLRRVKDGIDMEGKKRREAWRIIPKPTSH